MDKRAESVLNDPKLRESMLEHGLARLYMSMVQKQEAVRTVDGPRHESFVRWLAEPSRAGLLARINENALKDCWGRDSFVYINEVADPKRITARTYTSAALDELEKNLGDLGVVRAGCEKKLIDRFPMIVVYDVKTPEGPVTRCTTVLVPYVPATAAFAASHHVQQIARRLNQPCDTTASLVQMLWVDYFRTHAYADKSPIGDSAFLRDSVDRAIAAAKTLLTNNAKLNKDQKPTKPQPQPQPQPQTQTKPTTEDKSDTKHGDLGVTTKAVDVPGGAIQRLMQSVDGKSGKSCPARCLEAGTRLFAGSSCGEDNPLGSGQWLHVQSDAAEEDSRCRFPPVDGSLSRLYTYEVTRPLKLLVLSPDTFQKLETLDLVNVSDAPGPRPVLHTLVRVQQICPESKALAELQKIVVDQFQNIDLALLANVEDIVRERMMKILCSESTKSLFGSNVEPSELAERVRAIQDETACADLYQGRHALMACFRCPSCGTAKPTKDRLAAKTSTSSASSSASLPVVGERMIMRHVSRPMEQNITRWIAAFGDGFDGLYVPAMPTYASAAVTSPTQLALTPTAIKSLNLVSSDKPQPTTT